MIGGAGGHRPRKALGQHFLHERTVVARIVAAFAPKPADIVVEIGPGRGALTFELVDRVAALHAIELDRALAAELSARGAQHAGLVVHHADALKFDYCVLARPPERVRVIGNLPYNISTPLLFRLLAHSRCVRDMLLMLQKEVVDRIAAEPGGKSYGRLTVMVQQRCAVQRLFTVAPGAFTPAPEVDSAIVSLMPYERPPHPVTDVARFEAIVRAAFAQRRKTLRNALKGIMDVDTICRAGVDPALRAEQVTISGYVQLSNIR